jgi:maleylacetate reductase
VENLMTNRHDSLIKGTFTVQAQERVVFGRPAAEAVREEVDRLGARRVFLTSGRTLGALADGPLQRIAAALGEHHVGTFAAISAHSPREDVIAAANAARGAGADLLVAVGGGSVIDATKAVQMCLWLDLDHPDAMEPYRHGLPAEESRPIAAPADPVRMIAVSTTLSASEFTANAGVTDSRSHAKQSFRHRLFVPRVAVLDPAATLDTPDWLLYCTGIRAVDHAIESYCSPHANPATEVLSLQGLRLLARALPLIRTAPSDLQARQDAQFGMWHAISASAAGAGSGASHGIGYALGATFDVAHGHTSCVMLPAVLRWNAAVNSDRQRALAEAMGAPERSAGELVAALVASLEQPGTLRALGIRREHLPEIARRALTYPPVRQNPRPIRGEADVMEILELAW